jgi:hypothetical protein
VVDRSSNQVLIKSDIASGQKVLTSRLAEVEPGLRVEIVE